LLPLVSCEADLLPEVGYLVLVRDAFRTDYLPTPLSDILVKLARMPTATESLGVADHEGDRLHGSLVRINERMDGVGYMTGDRIGYHRSLSRVAN